ncbi:MAG: pilin [Patescibacteria group bacterium]|jgi:glucose uptake protein GlcU
MKNKIIKNLIVGSLALIIFLVGFSFSSAQDEDNGSYNFVENSGLTKSADRAGYDISSSATTLEGIISTAIYAILGLIGVVFMGLVIYGGATWMTAQGNEEKVKKAKGIITSSLIGLVITLSAYAISYFLISYFWKI